MRVFNIILGISSIFGAFYCVFFADYILVSPLWISIFLLTCWGICAMIAYYLGRKNNKYDFHLGIRGAVSFAMGFLGFVLLTVTPFYVDLQRIIQALIFTILFVWLFVDGLLNILAFFRIRKEDSHKKSAVMWLVIGICEVIVSAFMYFGYYADVTFLNLCIGICVAVFGIRLLVSAFAEDKTFLLD